MLCKKIITILIVGCISATAAYAQGERGQTQQATDEQPKAQASKDEPVEDEGSTIEKASFLIGFNTITRLKQQNAEYIFDKVIAGMNAANAGEESGMSREEQRAVLMSYQKIVRAKIVAEREALAEKNRVEGETALAEFAKQEGAKEIEDGVMYMVLKEGSGEKPEGADRVKIHYKGTYVDGEQFDSSIEKGEPAVNGVMQFVPGFTAALQAMPVGSKWKVIIRGDKAYGMRPRPPMEVNKTLIFEIELLEIMPIE